MRDMERLDYVTTDVLIQELMSRMTNAVLVLVPPAAGMHENDQSGGLMLHAMGNEMEDHATTLGLLELASSRIKHQVQGQWRKQD